MTDREFLEEMLRRFNLAPYAGGAEFIDAPAGGEVVLAAHFGGVDGYNNFHARFAFNEDGKFQTLGIWE